MLTITLIKGFLNNTCFSTTQYHQICFEKDKKNIYNIKAKNSSYTKRIPIIEYMFIIFSETNHMRKYIFLLFDGSESLVDIIYEFTNIRSKIVNALNKDKNATNQIHYFREKYLRKK